MPGSVSSLDSDTRYPPSDDGYDSEEEYLRAQQEWEESLAQLQQLASIVILPFVGRYFGRKMSYWAFARYTRFGLGKSFLFGAKSIL